MQSEHPDDVIFKNGRFSIWTLMDQKSHLRREVVMGGTPDKSEPVKELIKSTTFCCDSKGYVGVTLNFLLTDIIVEFAKRCNLSVGCRELVETAVKERRMEIIRRNERLDASKISSRFLTTKIGRKTEEMKWLTIMEWLHDSLERSETIGEFITLINKLILDAVDHLMDAAKKRKEERARIREEQNQLSSLAQRNIELTLEDAVPEARTQRIQPLGAFGQRVSQLESFSHRVMFLSSSQRNQVVQNTALITLSDDGEEETSCQPLCPSHRDVPIQTGQSSHDIVTLSDDEEEEEESRQSLNGNHHIRNGHQGSSRTSHTININLVDTEEEWNIHSRLQVPKLPQLLRAQRTATVAPETQPSPQEGTDSPVPIVNSSVASKPRQSALSSATPSRSPTSSEHHPNLPSPTTHAPLFHFRPKEVSEGNNEKLMFVVDQMEDGKPWRKAKVVLDVSHQYLRRLVGSDAGSLSSKTIESSIKTLRFRSANMTNDGVHAVNWSFLAIQLKEVGGRVHQRDVKVDLQFPNIKEVQKCLEKFADRIQTPAEPFGRSASNNSRTAESKRQEVAKLPNDNVRDSPDPVQPVTPAVSSSAIDTPPPRRHGRPQKRRNQDGTQGTAPKKRRSSRSTGAPSSAPPSTSTSATSSELTSQQKAAIRDLVANDRNLLVTGKRTARKVADQLGLGDSEAMNTKIQKVLKELAKERKEFHKQTAAALSAPR